MDKKYQPVVIEHVNAVIQILRETNFFKDYELENENFAEDYLCEKLTQKFIIGELDIELISDDEMGIYMREIIAGTILSELQEKGLIDSIEIDNSQEHFFLTDLGKDFAEKIKNNIENKE
jgi:hypothetical protein